MPLISVIIPVYNGEKTIRETIESVCNQTLSDWELIVINDGSQDSTLETLSSIQDPRLKVFSYPNAGQAASRNRGLALASGKYISFLDADDLWTADKLELQLKALENNPEAAVAYSWSNCIDESGQFYRRGIHIALNGDVYANLLLIYFLENGSNALIRRQALDEIGGFDESLPPAEDWDFWLRVGARYPFVAVPVPQILYRVSANSASTNIWRMERAASLVIERAFAKSPASLQYLKNPSLGNLYKYLTSKALEGEPKKEHILTAARLLAKALQYDRSLLGKKVVAKVLLKIAAIAILPPEKAQELFAKFENIFNTTTILGYLRRDPF
ncbi:MAG: glycosyltransferase [Oscillatoria sp. SIO1A7]|nr:glycosyltransferase [Oscillatoria sp. SIO1A7]